MASASGSRGSVLFFVILALDWIVSVTSQCLTSLNALAVRETLVATTDAQRTYTLCRNTVHQIGTLDYNYRIIGGQDMIPLRSNLHIKCGDTGSRDENCIVLGGDIQVDGTDKYGVPAGPLENVVLEGLTFVETTMHAVWINKPGVVEFRDCEFRDMTQAQVPVLLDYFDPLGSDLTVRFVGCSFLNNRFKGFPSQGALLVSQTRQNRLMIDRTEFVNNNMVFNNTQPSKNSFLIESSGPIDVTNSCFRNNLVGMSPVVVYGAAHGFLNNHHVSSVGGVCPFVSKFDTDSVFQNGVPLCSFFDATVCALDVTAAPTSTPTSAPTAPTDSPTMSPSVPPSGAPTRAASLVPSTFPTSSTSSVPTISAAPTSSPVISGSSVPTSTPSLTPSLTPSVLPSLIPSLTPSIAPSSIPSKLPSANPSYSGSVPPSVSPSSSPTGTPSLTPSMIPSIVPTLGPTPAPSSLPSVVPSLAPSLAPTLAPTPAPTQASGSGNPGSVTNPGSTQRDTGGSSSNAMAYGLGGTIAAILLAGILGVAVWRRKERID